MACLPGSNNGADLRTPCNFPYAIKDPLNVMPPIDEPKNKDVFITFVVDSVAENNGKSCTNVAKQVNTAAIPTRLKILTYTKKQNNKIICKIQFPILCCKDLWNAATSCGRLVISIRFATLVPIAPPRAVQAIIWTKTSADGAM